MSMLSVARLTKTFTASDRKIFAVADVSFDIEQGRTLGLVGESGCGKSTLGRAVTRLMEPTSGSIYIDNIDVSNLSGRRLLPMRRMIQMVFQDPYSSLNPRLRVARILEEPLLLHTNLDRRERRVRIEELAARCGLPSHLLDRFPHEFSGGQKQRIGIARALMLQPKVLVCDEAVSALDVSIRAQILNLLSDLQREFELTMLFISHDLRVVQHLSHRIAVMYLGRIVELGSRSEIYLRAHHPYTHALLSSALAPDPSVRHRQRIIVNGEPPSPSNPPSGCGFHPRCAYATAVCSVDRPELRRINDADHWTACHHAEQVTSFSKVPLGVEHNSTPNGR